MPHIEGTLSLVSNNFSKPTILTIVLQGAPPVGYVSLSTKFKVVHFFKRNEKTNKINCAYVIEESNWNGQTTIQLRIKDFEVANG